MEISEARKILAERQKGEGGETPEPAPARPIYRRDFPVAEDALAADAPERNLFAADRALQTAEGEAERVAGIVAQDQGLNAEGRVRKLQEAHADVSRRLVEPFEAAIDTYAQKLAGEKVSLLARVVKECAPDAARNTAIVEYTRDKVPERERSSFLARLSTDADAEALAAIIAAPRAFNLLNDQMRVRLTERLLELRGGKHFEELRQRDAILGTVLVNRESSQRRIRDRLLGDRIPMDEASIKARLVPHRDNNG